MISFQGILAIFFTFAPPGPGFIFRINQQGRWGGGNTLQRRIRCRFGSVLHSSRPLRNPECKPPLFVLSGRHSRWITSHNHNIFRDHFSNVCMALRSVNLPGVGTKYEIETEKGDTIAIFFTKSGTIQMYTLQNGCQTPSAAVMTPIEARRLGNILTGAIIEADKESVEIAFSALADLRVTIHTFYIPKSIAGKTIEDLQIRAKTGATIIAVCRHDKNIINPPPAFTFETGDAALVIGESDQIDKFEKEIMVE